MKTNYTLLLCLGLFFGIAACNTQPNATEQAKDTNDERFEDDMEEAAEALTEAYDLNSKILSISQMAVNQTSIPAELKSLAQQLQTDHQQLGQQLEELAGKYNIELPVTINYENSDEVSELRNASPEEFGEEFMDLMDDANESLVQTISELEDESEDVNTDLTTFAQQVLPTLEAHEEQMDQLEDAMEAM